MTRGMHGGAALSSQDLSVFVFPFSCTVFCSGFEMLFLCAAENLRACICAEKTKNAHNVVRAEIKMRMRIYMRIYCAK